MVDRKTYRSRALKYLRQVTVDIGTKSTLYIILKTLYTAFIKPMRGRIISEKGVTYNKQHTDGPVGSVDAIISPYHIRICSLILNGLEA